ncbi:hypothetical protein AVEN_75309-1 [Araneus ventricosus]|uniref:Uncharacterized protein n=1 Tax=Araneus ventricosus TaxID=182803 RepID=A0A4Y2G248_ARAVE|nr:hypothetical protein AVEN_75309-1 [Araneus ventricosus]
MLRLLLLPFSKLDPPLHSRQIASLPLHHVSIFCGFPFVRQPRCSTGLQFVVFTFLREPRCPSSMGLLFVISAFVSSHPLPTVAFQFHDPTLQVYNERS